jgi:hypothetical protein
MMYNSAGHLITVDMLKDTETIVPENFGGYVYIYAQSSIQCIDVIKSAKSEIPDHFQLYQNFPNPFNPTTTIRYDLPRTAFVTLKVYDLLGTEVGPPLVSKLQNPGSYEVPFDGQKLASGVYFYRINA